MDLNTLTTRQTSELNVKGPDGSDTDITIEVYSTDSAVYDDARAEMRDKLLDFGKKRISVEESNKAQSVALARCTKSWKNVQWKGKKLECTYENALMIYNEPGLRWLRDQVDAFMGNRENFLGN